MKYDVITIGGATEDITFYTKEGMLIANRKDISRQKLLAFEYGTKIKIDKSHSTFGGGAANSAISLSRLGFKVVSLLAVGRDIRGQRIIENLKNYKVDIKLIQKIKDVETGFSFLLVGNDNEHIVFSNRAANSELRITNSELRMLKKTKQVYLTSLSGDWNIILNKIFSLIPPTPFNKGGISPKISWNPGNIQLCGGINMIGKYLKKTEVLMVNKDEAIELVVSDRKYRNKPFSFLNKIENLLKILKSYGPNIVVITDGRHGAHAYNGNKLYRQKVVKEKKRVDTTGVGDAFNSSFTAGLELYNGDIKKAMMLGAKNSASVIAKQGAQNGLLTKKDIK